MARAMETNPADAGSIPARALARFGMIVQPANHGRVRMLNRALVPSPSRCNRCSTSVQLRREICQTYTSGKLANDFTR